MSACKIPPNADSLNAQIAVIFNVPILCSNSTDLNEFNSLISTITLKLLKLILDIVIRDKSEDIVKATKVTATIGLNSNDACHNLN